MDKPEKFMNKDDDYGRGYNNACDGWEKYHKQEIKAVDNWGEEWKRAYSKILKQLNSLQTELRNKDCLLQSIAEDCDKLKDSIDEIMGVEK